MEIAVIRDSLKSLGAQARWVPHELNCSDCLTKRKGNSAPLLEMLRTGRYQLVIQEEELKRRKEEREEVSSDKERERRQGAGPNSI